MPPCPGVPDCGSPELLAELPSVVATLVPIPVTVGPAVLRVPGIARYSRSSKSRRLRLNPVVLTFAMLLAMTSRLACCACMPVAPIYSDSSMVVLIERSGLCGTQVRDGPIEHGVITLQHLLTGLEVPHRLD